LFLDIDISVCFSVFVGKDNKKTANWAQFAAFFLLKRFQENRIILVIETNNEVNPKVWTD